MHLGRQGARVSCLARRAELLDSLVATLPGSVALPCDVADRDAVDAAFERAAHLHGPVHAMVAAAGIGGPNKAGAGDRFDEIVATNVTGTYNCLRAAEAHLAPGPEPRHLVVIASILGRFGVPGYTGYCASKAALLGMVKAFAMELAGQGALVNAICPGWVDTAMAWEGIEGMARGMKVTREEAYRRAMSQVPLGRMGTPAEVAGVVSWLMSESAAGVTGQGIDVNGGAWMG